MNPRPAPRQITLTVVIPTHNCLAYLPQALASIDAQGRDDLEVIVLDDNSNDGTWVWLQARAQHDPRIVPIRLDGVGPAVARNLAIASAQGEYIAFLDADDRWRAGKLDAQIAFHRRHPEVVFSFTDYRHWSLQGEELGTCFAFWPHFRAESRAATGYRLLGSAAALLFAENVVGTSCVVARRDALQIAKGFDESMQSASDWDLWLRLARQGSVGYSTQEGMDYLVRPDSITAKSARRIEALRTIYQRHSPAAEALGPWSLYAARARIAVAEAEHLRKQHHYHLALRYHLKAWLLSPSWRVARAALADLWHALAGPRREVAV